MNLHREKVTPILMGVLLMALLGLAGCTAVQALPLDASAVDVAEGSSDAALGPAAAPQALSPSYYRDDLSVVEGVANAPNAGEMRLSPTYQRDDPTLVYGAVHENISVEKRWGPTYHRDDPGLVYSSWNTGD